MVGTKLYKKYFPIKTVEEKNKFLEEKNSEFEKIVIAHKKILQNNMKQTEHCYEKEKGKGSNGYLSMILDSETDLLLKKISEKKYDEIEIKTINFLIAEVDFYKKWKKRHLLCNAIWICFMLMNILMIYMSYLMWGRW